MCSRVFSILGVPFRIRVIRSVAGRISVINGIKGAGAPLCLLQGYLCLILSIKLLNLAGGGMAEFKLSPHAYTTGLYNNKLNQKFSELIKITHKYVYHAPSYAKYSTCKHLILLTWQLHDLIVECNYKKFKKTSLRDLDITLEKLRSMWSLYYDLGLLDFKDGKHDNRHYQDHRKGYIETLLTEIVCMVGAWKKAYNAIADSLEQ